MYLIVILFGGFLGTVSGLGALILGHGLGTAASVYACVSLALLGSAMVVRLLQSSPETALQDAIESGLSDA